MYALEVRTTKDIYDEIRKCSTFTNKEDSK